MSGETGKIKKLTIVAMFAGVILAVTFAVKIPLPGGGGYINAGDAAVYTAALLLGGPGGAAAAAVGSALADLLAGYPVYIPATFIIKGAMALVCGAVARGGGYPRFLAGCALGGAVMAAGYTLYDAAVFGAARALAGLPFNAAQLCAGVAAASALYPVAKRLRGYAGWL
jgi:uncharacterized membrane protein